MNDIRTLLRTAGRRLGWNAFLRHAHLAALIAASIALGLMLIDRIPASSFVPWLIVGPALGVAALFSAAVAAWVWAQRRLGGDHVALAVDERLDLREKLSTALAVARDDDPFARAAVADAVKVAQDARTRERVRRSFPIAAPGNWWISPALVIATLGASFLPQADLFAADEPELVAANEQSRETVQSVEAVVEAIQEDPQLAEALSDVLGDLANEPLDGDEMDKTPEELKRDAIKKITTLNKRLEDILSGEKAMTEKALERALKGLELPENGPGKELAEALAKGDFKAAQEALKALMEEAAAGMNEEEREQLAKQLEQMAEQMQAAAQKQDALEQALKQAGLNPQLANNPQAMQQAIQQAQNLNEQQKQQLQQMAQACQNANQMCQGMGQAMAQMAQGAQQGQMGQMQQGGQQMQQMLNNAEMLQQLMQQAQAAQNACQGQCNGQGQGLQAALQQFAQQKQGGAMGQRGQGAGGQAPRAQTPSGLKIEQAKTPITEGAVIARQLIQGQQVVGESTVQLKQVIAEVKQSLEDGVNDADIPRKYHDAHKHYFGELVKLTETIRLEDPPAAPPASAPPAGDPPASPPADPPANEG